MGHNQTPMQTKPREQFVQIPNEEHRSTTVMNQTGTLNRTDTIKWPTIIICFILVITGQSIAKLLENYYYLHTTNKRRATWFQSLLQVIGFPFLHTPLYFLLYPDPRKPNQLPPSSDRTSLRFLTLLYPGIGVGMVFHARLYTKGKLEIPFKVFTLIYTAQLLFTTGKRAYILTMMGQVGAWQVYWVGLVGLVFAVSSMFSNVISVCTWPIVSLLGVLFFD
ncbi:unnamed protein product [Brassica oleracea var. botrytis]